MNIHPIFVHFPIAFLTVYCLLELVRFKFITSTAYWFYIKAFTVIVGAAGSIAAYETGEWALELIGDAGAGELIYTHSQWAKVTMVLFVVIAAIYALAWITRLELFMKFETRTSLAGQPIYSMFKRMIIRLPESYLMILPALAGLVCVTVTGALGATIVYGPDADFMVKLIYDLIFGG